MAHANREATADVYDVGFVGLGKMGLPLAARLVAADFRVVGIDPSSSQSEAAQAAGIHVSDDTSVLATAGIVITAVANEDQAVSLLSTPIYAGGEMAGSTLVLMCTVGPHAARKLAARAAAVGVAVADAPMTGGVDRAATGELTIFLAADPAVGEGIGTVLRQFGTVVDSGRSVGDGQSFKMVNNMLAITHLTAAAESIAFARRLGLDVDKLLAVLPAGTADSFMLRDRGRRLAEKQDASHVYTFLEILAKDAALISQTALDAGFTAPLATVVREQWRRAMNDGLGRMDDTAIIQVYDPRH